MKWLMRTARRRLPIFLATLVAFLSMYEFDDRIGEILAGTLGTAAIVGIAVGMHLSDVRRGRQRAPERSR